MTVTNHCIAATSEIGPDTAAIAARTLVGTSLARHCEPAAHEESR